MMRPRENRAGGPGMIRVLYEVECATCPQAQVSMAVTKQEAATGYRQDGWKETQAQGWICWHCAAKQQHT